MTPIFDSSADPNEIAAEVLSNGIAGLTGTATDVQEKIAVVLYLVDLLERSAATFTVSSVPIAMLAYVYDSDIYQPEVARRLVESPPISPPLR